jgi:hypothetical protein
MRQFSSIPLGNNLLTFTLFYLVYAMHEYNIVSKNVPTIFFLSSLIFFNTIWNLNKNCYTLSALLLSIVIGGGAGWLWGKIIKDGFKASNLLYFTGIENSNHCSRPTRQTFKCKVYKNGVLVGGK